MVLQVTMPSHCDITTVTLSWSPICRWGDVDESSAEPDKGFGPCIWNVEQNRTLTSGAQHTSQSATQKWLQPLKHTQKKNMSNFRFENGLGDSSFYDRHNMMHVLMFHFLVKIIDFLCYWTPQPWITSFFFRKSRTGPSDGSKTPLEILTKTKA